MSSVVDQILGITKPKVVITSKATGNRLYLDPEAFASGGSGSSLPFDVSLSSGDVPDDGRSTSNVGAFIWEEKMTLLEIPGPLGVPVGLWLGGLLALALVPVLKSGRR